MLLSNATIMLIIALSNPATVRLYLSAGAGVIQIILLTNAAATLCSPPS